MPIVNCTREQASCNISLISLEFEVDGTIIFILTHLSDHSALAHLMLMLPMPTQLPEHFHLNSTNYESIPFPM